MKSCCQIISWKKLFLFTFKEIWTLVLGLIRESFSISMHHAIDAVSLFSELKGGQRHLGGRKKCSKDVLKQSFRRAGVNYNNWEALARDRPKWRAFVPSTTRTFERLRNINDEGRWRWRRKEAEPRRNKIPASCCPTAFVELWTELTAAIVVIADVACTCQVLVVTLVDIINENYR